ncbi:YggT family protein [Comamonas sp. GB3 AK4-5]|uniref:YggT family protein n=1 Tax=Comamonas sp. GB3 AK4-5 TaxID=3231487 RepID=UPI00351F3B3A
MIEQILSFLLEVVAGLVSGACLLRLYMQTQRVPFSNPVGQLVFALTDWLVMPLRKLIKPSGKYDLSSLVGAVLIQLVHYLLLWALAGAAGSVVLVPLLALFGLLRMVLTGLIGLLIVYAILSWVSPHSPIYGVLSRLCAPVLRPLQRIIPLVGGVDLSPLAALVLLQVLLMVLAHLQFSVLGGVVAGMSVM